MLKSRMQFCCVTHGRATRTQQEAPKRVRQLQVGGRVSLGRVVRSTQTNGLLSAQIHSAAVKVQRVLLRYIRKMANNTVHDFR